MTILFETKSRQHFNNVPCVLVRFSDGDCGQASARMGHRHRGDDEEEEETEEHGGLDEFSDEVMSFAPNSLPLFRVMLFV